MASEENKKYKSQWEKNNTTRITFRLNKNKDGHIIRWLELEPNVSVYIRRLIEEDINSKLNN